MPASNSPLTDVPPKGVEKVDGSTPTLVLGILSIVLGLIPLVGLVLGTVGAIMGTLRLRKFQYTPEGNRIISFTPWFRLPASIKVGVILSYLGIVGGAFVTVIGGIILLTFVINTH